MDYRKLFHEETAFQRETFEARIRNCGVKSIREIMEQLFLFQYTSLSPGRQEVYLKEVVQMNIDKTAG